MTQGEFYCHSGCWFVSENKRMFYFRCSWPTAVTLMPIIVERINPGCIVISDSCQAYTQIAQHGFQNLTVNLHLNFVDPTRLHLLILSMLNRCGNSLNGATKKGKMHQEVTNPSILPKSCGKLGWWVRIPSI